jgi:hypothetical protein
LRVEIFGLYVISRFEQRFVLDPNWNVSNVVAGANQTSQQSAGQICHEQESGPQKCPNQNGDNFGGQASKFQTK